MPPMFLATLGGTDCERIGTGWLAQPANALSSLAYVAVGGWLLRRAMGPDTDRVLLVTTGTALAAVGGQCRLPRPPARLGWSGARWIDRLAGHGPRRTRRLATGSEKRPASGGNCRREVEGAGGVRGSRPRRLRRRTGGLLCRPESLWQPHAVWHVLSALGLGAAVFALADISRAEEPLT